MSIEALSGKVFLVVTGASRGIGKQIAVSFGQHLKEGSHALLLATNLDALKETAKSFPSTVTVDTVSIDLGNPSKEKLHEILSNSLKSKKPTDFDRLVLVHNVGTTGKLSEESNEMSDIAYWRSYYDLNVFGPAILNGVAVNLFKPVEKKVVVNITSLYGIQAGKYAGYYSTGKAAREMFFKVFALEHPEAIVLNYAPGPVETDMFHQLLAETKDEETKANFVAMRDNKTYLTTEQTVNRLLTVLKEMKFKNGDHVDYYDEL